MKKIANWVNSTKQHPKGVCEAAVTTWLNRIVNQDVQTANKIVPTDCDALQSQFESGKVTTLDLPTLLGNKAEVNPYDAFGITAGSATEIQKVLQKLKKNEFLFISAQGSGSTDPHALAVFNDGTNFYFFDPNQGIYEALLAESDVLAKQIVTNTQLWKELGGIIGKKK